MSLANLFLAQAEVREAETLHDYAIAKLELRKIAVRYAELFSQGDPMDTILMEERFVPVHQIGYEAPVTRVALKIAQYLKNGWWEK